VAEQEKERIQYIGRLECYRTSQKLSGTENVSVQVTVGDVKVQFSGTAESVMASVFNFLSKQVPSMDLARKISLSYDADELVAKYAGLVKITPEGPRVIPDSDVRLSDKDMVALQLVAARIAKETGKVQDDAMQVSDIQSATALNPKSISSRISEMVKAGHVARDEKEPGKYRITTAGIHRLSSIVDKKSSRT
jgi:predicted transcriptional regulator